MSSLTRFEYFPSLPYELRWLIWHFAASPPETPKPGVSVLPKNPADPRVVFESGSPAMILTSKEARQVALECSTTRTYDPVIDILYIPASRFCLFFRNLTGNYGPKWVFDVRHYATPLPPPDNKWNYRTVGLGMQSLKSLQIVSVVVPNITGKDDNIESTSLFDMWKILKPVEDIDMSGFKVLPGYEVDEPFEERSTDRDLQTTPENQLQVSPKEFQKQDNANIRDQLATFEAIVNTFSLARSRQWDPIRRRVNLKYEARYLAWY